MIVRFAPHRAPDRRALVQQFCAADAVGVHFGCSHSQSRTLFGGSMKITATRIATVLAVAILPCLVQAQSAKTSDGSSDTCAQILQESCGTGHQSCERGPNSRKTKYETCRASVKDSMGPNRNDPDLKTRTPSSSTSLEAKSNLPTEGLTKSEIYARDQIQIMRLKTQEMEERTKLERTKSTQSTPQCEPANK